MRARAAQTKTSRRARQWACFEHTFPASGVDVLYVSGLLAGDRSRNPLISRAPRRLAPGMPSRREYEANSTSFSVGVNRARRQPVRGLYTPWEILRDLPRGLARGLDRLRGWVASDTLLDGMTRRLIAFAVVGALVCGQVLAYADPPDPTWIAGFWDDADFDDVIVRITSTSSVTETGLSSSLEPHWAPIWTVPVADDRLDSSQAFAPHQPRGPPL